MTHQVSNGQETIEADLLGHGWEIRQMVTKIRLCQKNQIDEQVTIFLLLSQCLLSE